MSQKLSRASPVMTTRSSGRLHRASFCPTFRRRRPHSVACRRHPVISSGRNGTSARDVRSSICNEPNGELRRLWTTIFGALWVAVFVSNGFASTVVVIKVKSVSVSGSHHDQLPKGLSKGDFYIVKDKLINLTEQFGDNAGAVVGRDSQTLRFTTATTWTMIGTSTLPGGKLFFAGHGHVSAGNLVGSILVTGGTGKYAGARGTLVAGAGNSPPNTYNLRLP